jgi:long-subunit acyl-CoA synthetase (AMP-forming)/alkylation response protein AidB-like acyl-CoA dehydrogenase
MSADTTLVGLFATRLATTPDRPAVAVVERGTVTTWTWSDLAASAVRAAAGLEAAGLVRGDRIVHVGPHSPDWIVVDLACLLAGVVHVPLHADATAAEHREQLAWLKPKGVVFSGPARSGSLGASDLRGRVVVTPPGSGFLTRAANPEPGLGATIQDRARATDPDAPATIVLSSGTTGMPHGVVHSQRSLAWNARAVSDVFLSDPRDVRLSWLPASHLYARVGDLFSAIARGGCLHVVADRAKILDACKAMPPTVILGVPAFFERLEAGVRSGRISDLAAALGGEVRVCISGGAPLRERTAELFKTQGVPLVEGYGLAEAGPVVSVATPRSGQTGTVGLPLPGIEVRIDDRAESRGQLLVKTPSRAIAVIEPHEPPHNVPEWLETGDVGELDSARNLRITGRLKDVLVLPTGTKVPPAAIERALGEDDAVAQVCIVCDPNGWPVALVVPEPAVIRRAVRRLGIVVFSRRGAVQHPKLVEWMTRRLARRQHHLPRAWRVRRVVVMDRPFDIARGEITPSHKLRRDVIARVVEEKGEEEKGDRSLFDRAPRLATSAEAVSPLAVGKSARKRDLSPFFGGAPSPGLRPAAPQEKHGGQRTGMSQFPFSSAVWHGDVGDFLGAAARGTEPFAAAVEAILERAETEIARLREAGLLYDLPAGDPPPTPPIDDPPPPPRGRFSATAEAALGEAGLWGLAVPEAFGGAGASMVDLARAVTRLAGNVPTAAGMLAVHSSIGAVTALPTFGTPEQQARFLPGLAAGRPLSIFGATEPDAGCDLARVQSVVERQDGKLLLTGTKMFITNAVHGRLVKLLAMLDGKPTVVLVQLPDADTNTFRLRHYSIHPLQHTANAALEFSKFEISPADVLAPPAGSDGMAIVWHGLNRGRTTLAAQAAGTLRLLLFHAVEHAKRRVTWGQPIASRQLIQGRLGRIAASIAAVDAVSLWAAAAVDAGGGEWEAITAKIIASECVREAAIDALGVHGGRAFLVGHPLGDAFHDHLAVGVYEGESDLLGLALFRGIAKGHPLAALPRDAGGPRRAAAWLSWRAGMWARSSNADDSRILDGPLRAYARSARRLLAKTALKIDRAIRRHGRGLAEHQLEIGVLSRDVRDLVSILAVAHHADASGDDFTGAAAECWCHITLARVADKRATPADHVALAALGVATLAAGPSFTGGR